MGSVEKEKGYIRNYRTKKHILGALASLSSTNRKVEAGETLVKQDRAGETAQQLRVFMLWKRTSVWSPAPMLEAHNCLQVQLPEDPIPYSGLLRHLLSCAETYTHTHMHAHTNN